MLNRIDFKKLRVFLEYAVYLLLAMLLQGLLFSRLSIFGVKGFVLPAAVVAAGPFRLRLIVGGDFDFVAGHGGEEQDHAEEEKEMFHGKRC